MLFSLDIFNVLNLVWCDHMYYVYDLFDLFTYFYIYIYMDSKTRQMYLEYIF